MAIDLKLKAVKRRLEQAQKFKLWKILLVWLLLLFASATSLRLNHIGMSERRAAVETADELGDTSSLDQRLLELKDFVFNNIVVSFRNINGKSEVVFGTGPFYLRHQYERDAERVLAEAEQSAASNPNGNIYQAASNACDPYYRYYSQPYFDCILNELAKYPEADNIIEKVQIPSTELYRLDYASPLWTPSWAGWFIVASIAVSVVIFTRILSLLILKIIARILRKTEKSVDKGVARAIR